MCPHVSVKSSEYFLSQLKLRHISSFSVNKDECLKAFALKKRSMFMVEKERFYESCLVYEIFVILEGLIL
jgi:hypothetical protein